MNLKSSLKELFNPGTWFSGSSRPAEQMALGIALVLFLLSLFSYFRGLPARAENLSLAGAIIAGVGILFPRLLLPFEKLTRNLVFFIAWLNTKLILILVFYLVITPTGLLLRLFGKKLLETEINPERETYFEPREEGEYRPERDELQF